MRICTGTLSQTWRAGALERAFSHRYPRHVDALFAAQHSFERALSQPVPHPWRVAMKPRLAVRLISVCVVALAAACGGGGSSTPPAAKPGEKVKLTVALFGDFGFKPLYEEYKKTHPNVEVTEQVTQF